MCSDNVFWGSFLGVFQKRAPTHLDVWAIHYTTILSLINGILSRTIIHHLNKSIKLEFRMTNVDYHIQDLFLTFHRSH